MIILLSTNLNIQKIFAQEIQEQKKYNSIIIDEQIIKSNIDEIALNTALSIIEKNTKIENIFVGTFDSNSTMIDFYSETDKDGKWIDNLLISLENTSKNPLI